MSDEQFTRQLDQSYGLRNLKSEWMSAQRTSGQSVLVRSIRNSEIREISNGSLPWTIQGAHRVRLGTKVLVQIDNITNVGAQDPKAPSPRLLQFGFSDGATSFIGIELDTTKSSFSPNTTPGTKLTLLPTALLRRGRVLLTYEDYALIGAPQGRARASVTGQVTQTPPRHTGTGQSTGRSWDGVSVDCNMNPTESNIINVGGIAEITEESDDGGDEDELWTENLKIHSRYPTPTRQRVPASSPVRSSVAREPCASAWRNSIEREQPSNDTEANGAKTKGLKQRQDGDVAGMRGSRGTEKRAFPVGQQPSASRSANAVPMNADIDLTVAQPSADSPKVMEVWNAKQPEPAQQSGRVDIVNWGSPQIARLKDLTDSPHHMSTRPQICRLYAMKTGKRVDHPLPRRPVASTIVDDGTAVRIVSVLDELFDNLRFGCSPGVETLSQRADQGIRRFLRSIHGFVRVEFRDSILVVTAWGSEPVTVRVHRLPLGRHPSLDRVGTDRSLHTL